MKSHCIHGIFFDFSITFKNEIMTSNTNLLKKPVGYKLVYVNKIPMVPLLQS